MNSRNADLATPRSGTGSHRSPRCSNNLCEKNAVTHNPTHNPVKGVEPKSGEGKTPARGDHQASELLAKPLDDTIKSKRDRAILPTLLSHVLRREHARKGVAHVKQTVWKPD